MTEQRKVRGRRRKSPSLINQLRALTPKDRVKKLGLRYCFSKDGVYTGDGDFRWWQENDDSGYGWSGQFDIINLVELKHRIKAANDLGIPVYTKTDYGNVPEHEMYDLLGTVVGDEVYTS